MKGGGEGGGRQDSRPGKKERTKANNQKKATTHQSCEKQVGDSSVVSWESRLCIAKSASSPSGTFVVLCVGAERQTDREGEPMCKSMPCMQAEEIGPGRDGGEGMEFKKSLVNHALGVVFLERSSGSQRDRVGGLAYLTHGQLVLLLLARIVHAQHAPQHFRENSLPLRTLLTIIPTHNRLLQPVFFRRWRSYRAHAPYSAEPPPRDRTERWNMSLSMCDGQAEGLRDGLERTAEPHPRHWE